MDPLLTLLQSAFGDCPIIRQNMQASTATQTEVAAAIETRVKAEELREKYSAFCEAWQYHIDPLYGVYRKMPTFAEWKAERDAANYQRQPSGLTNRRIAFPSSVETVRLRNEGSN